MDVGKFVGFYANAMRRKKSGKNGKKNVMQEAHAIYRPGEAGNKAFTLEHAWRILREEPIFQNWLAINTKKPIDATVINHDEPSDFITRTMLNEAGQYSSGSESNSSTPISIRSESA